MAALSKASATAVFDLKSATLTVLAVVLKTLNLHELARAMSLRFDDSPGFFDHEPACLDLSAVRDVGEVPDFEDLLALLRHHGLNPIALRGGSPEQMQSGLAMGLAEAPDQSAQPARPMLVSLPVVAPAQLMLGGPSTGPDSLWDTAALDEVQRQHTGAPVAQAIAAPQPVRVEAAPEGDMVSAPAAAFVPEGPQGQQGLQEPDAAAAQVLQVVPELWSAPASPQALTADAQPTPDTPDPTPPTPWVNNTTEALPEQAMPRPIAPLPTRIHDKPLRSGQRIYARGSDLVVLGVVSFGAEVIADGSIHVYGPLRGRAIAGACGDRQARIFALSMQPQLVSIAGNWRTLEEGSFPEVAGKMAQVRLDGERLLLEPLRG